MEIRWAFGGLLRCECEINTNEYACIFEFELGGTHMHINGS